MCISRSSPQSHTGHTTTQSTLHFNMTRLTHELCKEQYYLCDPTSENATNFCKSGVCCATVGEEFCACQQGFVGERCDLLLSERDVPLTDELCNVPYYLCDQTSIKANGFCDNGVCCATVREEHCACQRGFGGERCDSHLLPSTSSVPLTDDAQQFVRVLSVMSVVAVAVAVVVVVVVVVAMFFYLRAKHARLEALKNAHDLQASRLQAATVVQPVFSWREGSVKRVKSVTRTATVKRPLSQSASNITALEFDVKATAFIPAATAAGAPGVPGGTGGPGGPEIP